MPTLGLWANVHKSFFWQDPQFPCEFGTCISYAFEFQSFRKKTIFSLSISRWNDYAGCKQWRKKSAGHTNSQVSIDNTFLLSLLIFVLCIAILHGFHVTVCIRIYQKSSCFTIFNGVKKICPATGEIRLLINGSDGYLQGSVWLHSFTWISFTSLCGFCYHSKWNAQRHKPSVHSFGIWTQCTATI